MKKIKRLEQLKAEKKRINQQQEELEDKIRSDWKELKECLRPVNIAKDVISNLLKNKAEKNMDGEDIYKNSLTYGISVLAKKFTDLVWEKLGKILSK